MAFGELSKRRQDLCLWSIIYFFLTATLLTTAWKLTGFARGAYLVRVLSAMIEKVTSSGNDVSLIIAHCRGCSQVGLIRRGNEEQIPLCVSEPVECSSCMLIPTTALLKSIADWLQKGEREIPNLHLIETARRYHSIRSSQSRRMLSRIQIPSRLLIASNPPSPGNL